MYLHDDHFEIKLVLYDTAETTVYQSCQADARVCKCSMDSYPETRPNHTCQPREKFWRDKRGATERSEPTSEGGSGGPPPENVKNIHCKWCNLRYSSAIFVNIISLYCNKTCINYASCITI